MPFPMKIQPIDSQQEFRESSKPPVFKARLKRLFDRPFNNVLKITSVSGDKLSAISGDVKDAAAAPMEFEPSSLCLDNMVQNFIEEITYDQKLPAAQKYGRNRCNCFSGNNNSSDDDEFDFAFGESIIISGTTNSPADSLDILKSLIPCTTKVERNLLADVSIIIEKNKTCKRKDDLRKIVTDGLLSLGFSASICKSKWEKSSSIPAAGEYEYIDVIMEGERVLIDIDFRSEFEIARSTGNYRAILQSLPFIFVGKADRLQQIIEIVSEAARQSLKKKGMHMAPWRKPEYMRAKWLSPFVRTTTINQPETPLHDGGVEAIAVDGAGEVEFQVGIDVVEESECGELGLIFGEKVTSLDEPNSNLTSVAKISGSEVNGSPPVMAVWQPPVVKSKSCEKGNRVVVTGLASLLKERP